MLKRTSYSILKQILQGKSHGHDPVQVKTNIGENKTKEKNKYWRVTKIWLHG